EPRRRTAFRVFALRLRALASLLLAERRRIAHPKGLGLRRFSKWDYSRDLRPAKWGSGVSLHSSNHKPDMSALGQKQTSQYLQPMSALPPIADMDQSGCDVRFVPKADIRAPLANVFFTSYRTSQRGLRWSARQRKAQMRSRSRGLRFPGAKRLGRAKVDAVEA